MSHQHETTSCITLVSEKHRVMLMHDKTNPVSQGGGDREGSGARDGAVEMKTLQTIRDGN